MLNNSIYLIIGAFLSIITTYTMKRIEWRKQKKNKDERGIQLLKSIIAESEMGIERCNGLIKMRKEKTDSFSRVYTHLWDSITSELVESLNDMEIIRLINSTYYYFDLINFNMNRGCFGVGAAFAEDKIEYINQNLSKIKDKLSKIRT